MKTAFEQVYGAPFLARLLFAEIGAEPENDLFLRVEYDGAIATNGATAAQRHQDFAVLSGTRQSTELMESFLKSEHAADASLEKALNTALDAWSIGHMTLGKQDVNALPEPTAFAQHRQEQVGTNSIEAAVLERKGAGAIRYRSLSEKETRDLIGA
jgi:proteasome alpha subunit